jgi:hypothetical protein
MRAHLLAEIPSDPDLDRYLAELHARAEAESIDELTARQLLLRLRERQLQRDVSETNDDRLRLDLQQALAKVRTAIREFA